MSLDAYILHQLNRMQARAKRSRYTAGPVLPVLVGFNGPRQRLRDVEGFEVSSASGNVFAGSATADALDHLQRMPGVTSIEASRPGAAFDAASPLDDVQVTAVRKDPWKERGANAIIGIIDSGFELVQKAFEDGAGDSRLLGVWDQTDSSGPAPKGFSYGRYYDRAALQTLMRGTSRSETVGPDASHGTKVASLAAGQAFTVPGGGSFDGGMAPEAGLVLVVAELRVDEGDPRSIGYSRSHLDGLDFIANIAAAEAGADTPVVVNVSAGMNAGSHDGTSLVEAGFDNFTEGGRLAGRVIVKSAGNLRESALHARLYTLSGGLETLEWESQDVDREYDTVEVWFYGADEHKFTLIAPVAPGAASDSSRVIGPGPGHVANSFAGGETYQMTLTRFHTDNGASQLLISIERTPTQRIRAGVWALEIASTTVYSHGQLEAWIEDQSQTTITFRSHVSREMTLTIPGTARTVVAVGAVKSTTPASMARASSQGPTRDLREKPDLAAPGVDLPAADSGDRVRLGTATGTSFAAPFVTGAAALLQSWRKRKKMDLLNAAQVSAALRQSAQGFHGGWNPSYGCGVLSAVKLLEVFAR